MKRFILILGMGAFFCSQSFPQALAKDTPKIEFLPSKWGIDYTKIADYPVSAILSHGEVEFRRNAKEKYKEQTENYWRKRLAPQVGLGEISNSMLKNMRAFTPKMLIQFAATLDPKDKKYGGLWSVGANFISEKVANW